MEKGTRHQFTFSNQFNHTLTTPLKFNFIKPSINMQALIVFAAVIATAAAGGITGYSTGNYVQHAHAVSAVAAPVSYAAAPIAHAPISYAAAPIAHAPIAAPVSYAAAPVAIRAAPVAVRAAPVAVRAAYAAPVQYASPIAHAVAAPAYGGLGYAGSYGGLGLAGAPAYGGLGYAGSYGGLGLAGAPAYGGLGYAGAPAYGGLLG